MKTPLLVLLALFAIVACHAQNAEPTRDNPAEKEEEIKIPSTLAEAHEELERLLPKEELAKIDAMKSEDEMIEYHFGPGMGMRNSWGLWGDSLLAKHMHSLGFTHADDMSSVILETFWCKRHGEEFRIKERANYYKAFWKEGKWPGDDVVDPDDSSEVSWSRAFGAEGRPHRVIYIGKSKKTGRWLAFENPTGVYVPDNELLKKIEESERDDALGDPFGDSDPQSKSKSEKDGAEQPATPLESKTEGDSKHQPKSEGRPQ